MRFEAYGDIPERDFRRSDFRRQTGSVACGVGSTCGVLHGGGRFLDYARNDGNKIVLRKEV